MADGEEETALNNIINADYNTRLTKEVALELAGLLCEFLPEEVMEEAAQSYIIVVQ